MMYEEKDMQPGMEANFEELQDSVNIYHGQLSPSTEMASFQTLGNHEKSPNRGFKRSHFSPSGPLRSSVGPNAEFLEECTSKNSDMLLECEVSTPEYSTIASDLQQKLDNFSHNTTIPFFVKRQSIATFNSYVQQSYCHTRKQPNWQSSECVRLPHSPMNVNMSRNGCNNWTTIVEELSQLQNACRNTGFKSRMDQVFGAVVSKYSPDSCKNTNFGMLSRQELQVELINTMPIIVDLALKLPNLLAQSIPMLKSGKSHTIYLTRYLCASILANCFFCTFPSANHQYQLRDFNFYRLYNDTETNRCETKKEKLKCILNYFKIISNMNEQFLNEIVSFERRCVRTKADWENSKKPLCNVKLEHNKGIEDAEEMLQIDFANKYVGGGVLNDGCAMEEIRFCISPELLVSRIFIEKMEECEVVIITGSQIYSKYTGYSTSFKYAGPFQVQLKNRSIDNFGRTFPQIAAIDATDFSRSNTDNQYKKSRIDRELHKCYVAFIHGRKIITPVATGNWGCGAFGGNPELKFLLQWIAASHQDRPLLQYHKAGDRFHSERIQETVNLLQSENVTVGAVYYSVTKFYKELHNSRFGGSLLNYIRHKHGRQSQTVGSRYSTE